MPWSPYPKIPSRARLGSTAPVREWAAVEKVHGANFAIVCDRDGTHPAKRRALLGGSGLDDFFGVGRIWPRLAVAAGRLATVLRRAYGDGTVTVYGELAGGRYPHPGVLPESGAEPVQTGVWYAPGLYWLPFDATVEAAGGEVGWVADRALREAADDAGLLCAPLLVRGPLSTVQSLPALFPTRVPALLGLPPVPDNLAEGLVIKPAGEWPAAGTPRPVAKVKQPAFAEDERFDGSRPYRPPFEGAAGVPGWLVGQVTPLLTPARAAAAVSKLGPHTPVQEVAEEITADVVDEVAEAIGGLAEATRRALVDVLRPGAVELARFDAADRRSARL